MSVYYNDIEVYPCEVLRARINDGLLPAGLVDERDICTVSAQDIAPYAHVHLFAGVGVFALGFLRAGVPLDCHIMTGGFPCQDLSVAGKQAGLSGERSGLWFQMVRLIDESNAIGNHFDFIVIENVRNLLSGGDYAEDAIRATDSGTLGEVAADTVWQSWMGTVLADLAEVGYDAEWQVLAASDYGAPHRRERIFIVAYPCKSGTGMEVHRSSGQEWQSARTPESALVRQEYGTHRPEGVRAGSDTSAGMAHTHDTRCADAWHVSDRQVPGRQEPGREQSADRAGRSSTGELADASSWQQQGDSPRVLRQQGWQSAASGREDLRQTDGQTSSNFTRSDDEDMADAKGFLEGRLSIREAKTNARSAIGSQDMADASEQGLPLRGYAGLATSETQASTGMESEPERYGALEYPDSQRCQEQHIAAIASPSRWTCESDATPHSSWNGQANDAESRVCRVLDGTPHRLHGYHWPARPGEQQYSWEPLRVITEKVPFRNFRLKALGNALMLPIAEDIGHCIKAVWLARRERTA